jgi:hypothetical protein
MASKSSKKKKEKKTTEEKKKKKSPKKKKEKKTTEEKKKKKSPKKKKEKKTTEEKKKKKSPKKKKEKKTTEEKKKKKSPKKKSSKSEKKLPEQVTIEINREKLKEVARYVGLVLIVAGLVIGVDALSQLYIKNSMAGKIDGQYISKRKVSNDLVGLQGSQFFETTTVGKQVILDEAHKRGLSLNDITEKDLAKEAGLYDQITEQEIEDFYAEKEKAGFPRDSWSEEEVKDILAKEKLDEHYEQYQMIQGFDTETLKMFEKIEILKFRIVDDPTEEEINTYLEEQGIGREDYDKDADTQEQVDRAIRYNKFVELLNAKLGRTNGEGEVEVENYFKEPPAYEIGKTYRQLWDNVKSFWNNIF